MATQRKSVKKKILSKTAVSIWKDFFAQTFQVLTSTKIEIAFRSTNKHGSQGAGFLHIYRDGFKILLVKKYRSNLKVILHKWSWKFTKIVRFIRSANKHGSYFFLYIYKENLYTLQLLKLIRAVEKHDH